MRMYGFNFTFVALVFLDRSQSAHLITEASAVQKYHSQKTPFSCQMQKTPFC